MVRNDAEEKKKKIIDAAFKVFTEKGFKGATNRDIAEAAGITTGLIYWYFKDKEDLFNHVFEAKSPAVNLQTLNEKLMDAPPEIYFSQLAHILLDIWLGKEYFRAMRLVFSEIIRFPSIGQMVAGKIVATVHLPVKAYIAKQVKIGRFRPVDPMLATQMFVGSLISFVLLGNIIGAKELQRYVREEIVQTVVSIFLNGMEKEGW